MPYNYDSSSLKQALMKFVRNLAEALGQVGTGSSDENANKIHGRCRLYLLLQPNPKNVLRTA